MVSKVYINRETALVWKNTGGDAVITLASLAASTGRQGAQVDRGAGSFASRYRWRFWTKFATAPVLDERIRLFIKTSDGTIADNDDGTGDIALSSSDKLKNLLFLGDMRVDEAATAAVMSASGFVEIDSRYINPVVYNATVDSTSATATDHGFSLTPAPFEGQ